MVAREGADASSLALLEEAFTDYGVAVNSGSAVRAAPKRRLPA